MNNPFRVGDRVRRITDSDHPDLFGKKGQEYTVLCINEKESIFSFYPDGAHTVKCCDFELVEEKPAKRLYRKGDKVRVEFTVEEDQVGEQQAIYVSSGTLEPKLLSIKRLNTGTLTPAPEPVYIPKAGDWFRFDTQSGPLACLCIHSDDRSVTYESPRGYRYCQDIINRVKPVKFIRA